jgi:two-component system sensor histidine kinase UhpB
MSTSRQTPQHLKGSASVVRALLGFPMLYKLLIANVAIVVLGAVVGTAFTAELVRVDPTFSTAKIIGVFGLIGVGVSALANVVVLKLALSPLKRLEQTAKRIERGELDAYVPQSPLADTELQHLTETFNHTLTRLASYRRRLRDAGAAAVRAAEGERKRIARELHDETAPALVALLVRLRVARAAGDPTTREAQLEEVRDGLVNTIEGLRRIARALRPAALDEMGVVRAIEDHARSLSETTGLRVEVAADRVEGLLTADAELALYRTVQEALSNAVRHAAASVVHVRIERRDNVIVAVISDDGMGFAVAEELHTPGAAFGLFGMQERAEYLGGRVEISSSPGEGAVVRIQIPVGPERDIA